MNVRLTDELEQFVKRLVAEGRYISDAEVIREGLRLLQDQVQWRADVCQKVADGVAEAKAGQFVDGHEAIQAVLAGINDVNAE